VGVPPLATPGRGHPVEHRRLRAPARRPREQEPRRPPVRVPGVTALPEYVAWLQRYLDARRAAPTRYRPQYEFALALVLADMYVNNYRPVAERDWDPLGLDREACEGLAATLKPIRSHGAGWLLLAHYLGTLDDHAGALEAARRATELAPRD